jgi:hypothetical protein
VNRSRSAKRRDDRRSGGRPPRSANRGDPYRLSDIRHCAQRFARPGVSGTEARYRPSRSEVRRLRKEVEALHQFVIGEASRRRKGKPMISSFTIEKRPRSNSANQPANRDGTK